MKIGLHTKLLAPTLSIVILCMGVASYFSAEKGAQGLWKELIDSSTRLGYSLGKGLGMFVEDIQGAVILQSGNIYIKQVLSDRSQESLKNASDVLKDLVKFDPSIQGANLLDLQGNVVASSDPKASGNFADREYFKQAVRGKTNIGEPLISRVTNKPVFMVATPVNANNALAGVLYVRVDLGKFSEDMVLPVKIGQNGYAFLADKAGIVFSHPDKDLILKLNISQFAWGKSILASPSGKVDYELNGKKGTAVFSKDTITGWTVIITVNPSDTAESASAIRNSSLLFSAVGILLVGFVIVFIIGAMLKALDKCVAFSSDVANGSMKCCLEVVRDDELGRLADSLRTMVESLRNMVVTSNQKTIEAERQTKRAEQATADAELATTRAEQARAEGMLDAAKRLQGVVAVVGSASQALSTQIGFSSQGSEQQAQRISETATAMEEMNATVLEVAKNASQAAATTDDTRHKARDGARIVGQVVKGIAAVQAQALALKKDMSLLGEQAEGIGRVMNVISDIADQTNLLALNAAIEAARAGEAGRGFAVVADEVRKLAEKTMTATKEVGDAIAGIQEGARKNMENVDQAAVTITEATSLANTSGAALDAIVSLVESASDQVRSIATAAEEQSAASEEINKSIEQVAEISDKTSDAMRQANQAVAELARQTQELRDMIAELERGSAVR